MRRLMLATAGSDLGSTPRPLPSRCTHLVHFELGAGKANTLEDLFHLDHEAVVENWTGELDVAEMAGTLCHALETRLALKVAVDGCGLLSTARSRRD
jgi:hypothetical protein